MRALNNLNDEVQFFAKNIADRLSEVRMYEVQQVIPIITTRIKEALFYILQSQLGSSEKERSQIAADYSDPSVPGWKKLLLQKKLSELNIKTKAERKAIHLLIDDMQYSQVKKYIRENHPQVFDELMKNVFVNNAEWQTLKYNAIHK